LSIRIDSEHGDCPEKALRVEQRGCNKSHDASPNFCDPDVHRAIGEDVAHRLLLETPPVAVQAEKDFVT
jgi:hypothetical protein